MLAKVSSSKKKLEIIIEASSSDNEKDEKSVTWIAVALAVANISKPPGSTPIAQSETKTAKLLTKVRN